MKKKILKIVSAFVIVFMLGGCTEEIIQPGEGDPTEESGGGNDSGSTTDGDPP